MTELEFYKYLFDDEDGLNPEMRWSGDELLIFLYYFQVEDFFKTVTKDLHSYFDDGGVEAHLMDGYLVFDIVYLLEYMEIEPENILARKED